MFLGADTDTVTDTDSVMKGLPSLVNVFPRRFVDKDELTTGISVYENDHHAEAAGREGFSIGIIKGDDSGVDHRRYNKFVEQDSRDFTDKYFSSKQCSIGNSAGGVTMFGSNELLGDSRTAQISGGIYNFAGKWVSNETDNATVNAKRYTYFKDCVYSPITRYNFRDFKKDVYNNINKDIINIQRCLNRFNTNILFDTQTDDAAGYSRRLTKLQDSTVKGALSSISYVSLIARGNDKPEDKFSKDKFSNIQPLNRGNNADNASETTYSALLKKTNEQPISESAEKQRKIEIYGKVYGYRQRIDQILEMMRKQAKNDAANIDTINISEEVVEELRLILSYLAIIERTNAVILFEEKNGYYDTTKTAVTDGNNTLKPLSQTADVGTITGYNNIFRVPLLDDTYNTNDEKRYIYGITFYFDKVVSTTPYA